jgi:hypothetical protein
LATHPKHSNRGGAVHPGDSTHGYLSFTCTVDKLNHFVSDDAAVLGLAAGRGTYGALCGHLIYTAALASSSGSLCPGCIQTVLNIAPPVTIKHGRQRNHRHSRLGRLFSRLILTAVLIFVLGIFILPSLFGHSVATHMPTFFSAIGYMIQVIWHALQEIFQLGHHIHS